MFNNAQIIGRLGRDPEARYTQDGTMVVKFSVATDESFKNKQGEKVKKTEWHNVSAFGKLAEICGNYLVKGSLVFCEGRLETSKWEKDGVNHTSTGIILNNMKMLGGTRRDVDQAQAGGAPDPGYPDPNDDVPF